MKTYIVRMPVAVDRAEQIYSVEARSVKHALHSVIHEQGGELLGIEYVLEEKFPEDAKVFEEVQP